MNKWKKADEKSRERSEKNTHISKDWIAFKLRASLPFLDTYEINEVQKVIEKLRVDREFGFYFLDVQKLFKSIEVSAVCVSNYVGEMCERTRFQRWYINDLWKFSTGSKVFHLSQFAWEKITTNFKCISQFFSFCSQKTGLVN